MAGWRLEALEFLEGRNVGVLVVEVQDEADRHLIVFQVIQERATAGVGLQRPSEGVLDQARPVLVGRNLPELLQPDAELSAARDRPKG